MRRAVLRARAPSVLVVEDDPHLRELYRLALTASGYAVVAVEDGLDALRYLEGNAPSAVVLDLGLVRVDGRDVQREMAAHGLTDRIPIIVVTGQSTGFDERDFACVLRKPIDPSALMSAVADCLRRVNRQRRQSAEAGAPANDVKDWCRTDARSVYSWLLLSAIRVALPAWDRPMSRSPRSCCADELVGQRNRLVSCASQMRFGFCIQELLDTHLSVRPAALLALGVRPQLAAHMAGSGLAPWYLARAKALSVGLSNAYFDSLGLPRLIDSA